MNPLFWRGDAFGLVFDPVNEKTNGFVFAVNPEAVQSESLVTGQTGRRGSDGSSSGSNGSWDNKWYSEVQIFEDKWTVIGVASSVPNPGDVKPFDLLGIPLLIVRNRENKIKVFHNVCSHRGLKLVSKSGNIKNVIRCPYHSWSYTYDGNLIATPHIGGMNKHQTPKFKKSNSNLKEVRSHVWLDLIMVNISNNAISFEKYIKPLSDRWSKFWPKKDRKLITHADNYGYFKLNAKNGLLLVNTMV